MGQGIPTGRVFGIDAPALLSDRSIELRPLIDRLVAVGVRLVRTQATVPRPASRQPQSNWHVCPNVEGQLVEWREIRDTRLVALMAAGIRVQLDLFDDPGLVHSAAHLALRDPAARARLNAWAGLPPSEATARTLADRYLSRLPKELRRGLLVGVARDLREAGFDRAWTPRVAGAVASAGIRNPMPVAVPAGQTSDLPTERSLLTIGLNPHWIDGTRLPVTKHREVVDYLDAVKRGAPGSHLVFSTAGMNPGPETPDAWSEVSARVVAAVAGRLELAS